MHQQSGESLRDRVSNNKQRFHFGARGKKHCSNEYDIKLETVQSKHERFVHLTPKKTKMSPKKGPFQKEMIVFQPSFLRGELLIFGGGVS